MKITEIWITTPDFQGVTSGTSQPAATGDSIRGSAISPGVMRGVGDYFLAVGGNRNWKLDGLAVLFFVGVGLGHDVPVLGAIQMFDHSHFDCFLFVIAHLDLKCLCCAVFAALDGVIHAPALARE